MAEKQKSDKVPVTLRFTPMVKAQLDCASDVLRIPLSDLATAALIKYFEEMSPADRKTMEVLMKNRVESGRI
jgi:hypothetical protein